MVKSNFSLLNLTRHKLPNWPWLELKKQVLGENYNLSLVFIGDEKSKQLNQTYRGKNKPANVLSFPLSKTGGEIFLNPNQTKDHSLSELFIHGLLHLKGLDHGSRMESAEKKLARLFLLKNNAGKFNRWSRHRHRPRSGGSVRTS